MFYTRRSKVITVVVALLIAAAVSAILFFSSESEPRYNGKGIREWALFLSYGAAEQIEEGRIAIKTLGPAALPYLIRMLEKQDSRLEGWLRKYAFWFGDMAGMSHAEAATALRELGPQAQSAIPALEKVARQRDHLASYKAEAALMVIRNESSETLKKILEDRSPPNRSNWVAAAMTAAELGNRARPLIPSFIDSLDHTNSDIRQTAISALGSIAMEPEVCVPAILRGLADSDETVRFASLLTLPRFPGATARAQTEIQRCFADPDPYVRFMAVSILSQTVSSLDSNSLGQAVQPLRNDPDEGVRSMAENLLNELRKPQQ